MNSIKLNIHNVIFLFIELFYYGKYEIIELLVFEDDGCDKRKNVLRVGYEIVWLRDRDYWCRSW